jgi:hypothetical protein
MKPSIMISTLRNIKPLFIACLDHTVDEMVFAVHTSER